MRITDACRRVGTHRSILKVEWLEWAAVAPDLTLQLGRYQWCSTCLGTWNWLLSCLLTASVMSSRQEQAQHRLNGLLQVCRISVLLLSMACTFFSHTHLRETSFFPRTQTGTAPSLTQTVTISLVFDKLLVTRRGIIHWQELQARHKHPEPALRHLLPFPLRILPFTKYTSTPRSCSTQGHRQHYSPRRFYHFSPGWHQKKSIL